MTVSTDIYKVSFAGDGATKAFPLGATFFFYDDTDLAVYVEDETDNSLTTYSLGVDYSVTGGDGSTGTVTTLAAAALTTDQTLWVVRVLPLTQLTDLQNNGLQDADTVELMSDKLTAIAQQLAGDLSLTIRAPITEDGGDTFILPSKSERAGKYLAFTNDSDATPIAATPEQVVLGDALAAIQPLSPSSGKLIEYTGSNTAQLIDTSSAGGGLIAASPVALSGLSIATTAIPTGVDRITIGLISVTLSSAVPNILVRLSTGGVDVTTGYQASCCRSGATGNVVDTDTSGFPIYSQSTAYSYSGHIMLTHVGSNVWVCDHTLGAWQVGVYETNEGGGTVSVGGEVDEVVLVVTTGTFDTGFFRVFYETGTAV